MKGCAIVKLELRPLRSTFSFDVFKVLEGHTEVVTFVYLEMTGSTKGNLFTVDTRHHLPSPPYP